MLSLLIACVTEASFPGQAATTTCRLMQECDRGAFEEAFSDLDDCVDTSLDLTEEYYACLAENCEFVASEASACLSGYRSQTCEEYSEGSTPPECEDIFDDCDESDVLACGFDIFF